MVDAIPGIVIISRKRDSQISYVISALSDAERSKAILLHEAWIPDHHYDSDEVVQRRGSLYRCNLAHTSQPAWTPEDAPSLWTQIMFRDGIRIIPEVIQATQAFAFGEVGWWGDALFRSLIDANVYTPDQYPAGWEEAVLDD